MLRTGGNLSKVEDALGLPKGYLSSNDTMVVHIKSQDIKGLKIPSGNERGVDEKLWIPGGYTRGGTPEAVVDLSHKPTLVELNLKRGSK